MRGWDSFTSTGRLRLGPAALIVLLSGALLSLAPISQRIEGGFYDLVQHVQERDASREILVVDTTSLRNVDGSIWESERLPALLETLRQAGARLVLMADPPPVKAGLPDYTQLAALAEIEQRSQQDVGKPGGSAFASQLAEMRHRVELHERAVQATARLRNVIIAVPTREAGDTAGASAPDCRKFLLQSPQGTAADQTGHGRRVGGIEAPPGNLCAAVLGLGHADFWPDADGVVRRLDLIVNSAGSLLPSAALSAAMAMSYPSSKTPVVSDDGIAWNSHQIRTSEGAAILARFYSTQDPQGAFEAVTAQDLMADTAARKSVAGRIIVLGDAAGSGTSSAVTPLGAPVSATHLLATGLSNLMQDDYLVRPDWMPVVETVAMVVIGLCVLLWGGRLPPAVAAMAGLVAATLLLGAEALLLHWGIWAQLATASAFLLCAIGALRLLQPASIAAGARPATARDAGHAGPQPAATPAPAENELDLQFSMLRHQQPSDHVKQRLYDIALEHARQRDLAKAERVLRHLASIDPDYRNAAEKLTKLSGMRVAARTAEKGPQPPRPLVPVPSAPGAENLSGRTIGRYEIEQPIGRGAMATVYLGRDPKINRRVAIKTIALAEEFSDTDLANARTQFLREAESAGRLNHPNIISIYDAGEDGQVAYLAMEYFAGKPLSFYAQQGQMLPAERVLEIVARAADALNYAHNQNVVHRDVKPANLLYDAATDTLKITDFGIARLTDASRTKTGIILGTPSYMSPEQLAGTSVSGQSDLFSLGITLYQLLTGAPPFRADSIPKLMQKIAHERHAPVTQVRDDLPPAINAVLDRALAKDPADRFPNGRAMALALRDCCSSFALSPAVQSA